MRNLKAAAERCVLALLVCGALALEMASAAGDELGEESETAPSLTVAERLRQVLAMAPLAGLPVVETHPMLPTASPPGWPSPAAPPADPGVEQSAASPGIARGAYVGCFKTVGSAPCLDGAVIPKWDRPDHQTPAWCVGECGRRGFAYAGWQVNTCFCGNQPAQYGRVDDSQCPRRLVGPVEGDPGNPPATAGESETMSVYAVAASPAMPQPAAPIGQPAVAPTPLGPAVERTFRNPDLGTYRLDWCREWATNCGQLAADAWCLWKGFARATSYDGPDMAPGATQLIGTGQLCQGEACGSFYAITCE